MAEVMLGKELHPDRVILIEKLYEILNEHGINYSFQAQYGIENNAFAVVRCKDCKHWHGDTVYCDFMPHSKYYPRSNWYEDDFCSYGERKDNG